MFPKNIVDGAEPKIPSLGKRKRRNLKKKRKPSNEDDPPSTTPLTTDHFDLTIKRLEDAYLEPIKDDIDSVEKSMSKIKLCVEIVCIAIAGAAIIYVIDTILKLVQ